MNLPDASPTLKECVLNEPAQRVFANEKMKYTDLNDSFGIMVSSIYIVSQLNISVYWGVKILEVIFHYVLFCFFFFTNHFRANFTNIPHVKAAQDCWSQLQSDPRRALQVQ